MVLLPSSFSGSPQALKQNFIDSMTIVKKKGNLDLFITLSCNEQIVNGNNLSKIYVKMKLLLIVLILLLKFLVRKRKSLALRFLKLIYQFLLLN